MRTKDEGIQISLSEAEGQAAPAAPSSALTSEGLHRQLSPRQLTMIAIGGAIGVGLFLGSSVTVKLAGPAVIISYLLGACITVIVAFALAEMAVIHPVAGSFGVYAERYLSRWAGFSVRATYGLIQIIAIGAEVTAVAIYLAFWFPGIPAWVWIAAASLGLVTVNNFQVGYFGEFEYWFAFIKVAAIIVFIVVGTMLIFGLTSLPAIGFTNLTARGGFMPNGWRGVWLALTLVITSYMGVEVIAVTAGEAQFPERSVPAAMRTILFRLILFYGLAITVMLAMSPWDQIGAAGIDSSPFVRAFAAVHIPYAASLMNMVVITAALSSANTNLYLTSRMLFSLSRDGYAPDWLGQLSRTGVPRVALALSTGGMIAAIFLALYAPQRAFLLLYGTAVAGMFFVWIIVLMTHLRFRNSLSGQDIEKLRLRLPFHPIPSLLGLAALVAIAGSTFFVSGLEYTIPTFAAFLCALTWAYWIQQRRAKKIVGS
jgi:amino acid transporter, AAT family